MYLSSLHQACEDESVRYIHRSTVPLNTTKLKYTQIRFGRWTGLVRDSILVSLCMLAGVSVMGIEGSRW